MAGTGLAAGRPSRKKTVKTVGDIIKETKPEIRRIHAPVTLDMHKEIRLRAVQEDSTIADLVKRALRAYLDG